MYVSECLLSFIVQYLLFCILIKQPSGVNKQLGMIQHLLREASAAQTNEEAERGLQRAVSDLRDFHRLKLEPPPADDDLATAVMQQVAEASSGHRDAPAPELSVAHPCPLHFCHM